jgi:hypothetical protein
MRAILATTLLGALALGALPYARLHAQGAPQGPATAGKQVFQRANCVGCHKWHGGGGGGYGGDALSLRATQLDRDQIIETVTCGRPGTGMPYFRRGAYDGEDHPCYGLGRQDLGKDVPVEATIFLRPNEVGAVADYVIADIKGKGEPNYAECAAFFGDGARVCNIYKDPSKSGPTAESAQPGKQGS